MQLDIEPPSGQRDSNEQILLDVVGKEVRDRNTQSLHHIVLLSLGQRDSSFTANLPRQGQLHLADGSHQSLSKKASICDLFDHSAISGRLLIVGPTGTGKTTALLELAAELVHQATHDPEALIPVLFHLSSWPADQQSLEDWLRMELRVKYGVSKTLSNQWLEANVLFPLLDGLDELAPYRRDEAVQKINQWLAHAPGPLVVCCRYANDEQSPVPLALNGSLALEALTSEQLEQYLAFLHLNDLWAKLQQWPEWLDLMRVPLWLNLVILTRDSLDFPAWAALKTPQARQDHLLDGFMAQQLHQPPTANATDKPHPTAQQTRHWLQWLARQVHEQSEHEFLIENLQPTLLSNRRQIIRYSVLGGLIFGLMGGLVFGLFINRGAGLFVASIIITLFVARRGDDAITAIDTKPTTRSLMQFIFVRQLNPLLFFLAAAAITFAFIAEGIDSYIFLLVVALLLGLLFRLMFALPSLLIGSFVSKINRSLEADIANQTEPNQSIQETLLFVLRTVAMFMPLLMVIKITPLFWSGRLAGPIDGDATWVLDLFGVIAAIALWATIFDSALACAQHLALRLVLFRSNAIPWNYARFLNHCCDRHLLQRVGGRYQFIHRLVQERLSA